MTGQQPLALPPPAGNAAWSESPLLDASVRRALSSINQQFLELAADLGYEGKLALVPGLPPRAVREIGDADARRRLCDGLPYALFDLRFGDGAWWEAQVQAAAGVLDAELTPAPDDRILSLARAATVLAWHLCQSRRPGAQLVLGASPATLAALGQMPLAHLEALARRVAPALNSRFGARAHFWRQFAGCATEPSEDAVVVLHRLGLQLHGADSARSQQLRRRLPRLGLGGERLPRRRKA